MSMYAQITETMQKEFKGVQEEGIDFKKLKRDRLLVYRKAKHAITRIEKPTNLARARSLGYKAKQGIIVVRVRVRKGSGTKTRPTSRRRPKRMGVRKLTRKISIKSIAEQRAARKHPNLEVLNSYYVGEDGIQKYFEVILVDPMHPSIRADKELNWICRISRGRAFRGLTSSERLGRGLRK
jgi:large subunit ribosomal protein L15e